MGKIIGGAAQIAGSLVGGRARRREAKEAGKQQASDLAGVRNFQFQNKFANKENIYEDQTIDQQSTDANIQQSDQALSGVLDTAQQSGGPVDVQSLANAALQSKQGINNDIASQERGNQQDRLSQQNALNQAEDQGANELQSKQFGQQQQNLDLSSGRKNAADAAREQATQQLVGGIGSVAGGVASAATGGIGGIAGKLFGG